MTGSHIPGRAGNTGKRQEFIRQSFARSRQFASELKEVRKYPPLQALLRKLRLLDDPARDDATVPPPSAPTASPETADAGWMDPVRVKRNLSRIIKVLIVWELLGAIIEGVNEGNWTRFVNDAIIATILFFAWGRILSLVARKRVEYRQKMEIATGTLRTRDALIFSLLWSDEIFTNIPPDRRRIASISYSLIALGVLVAIARVGGAGVMPLALAGALVLAAVNLLVWVVSLERGAKESLQTELRLAHEVQDSLMPLRPPVVPGLDVAGISIPAQDVGGDLFDYAAPNHDTGKVAIAVADVSGKGMKAAMASVYTSGAFSTEIRKNTCPAAVLTQLNKAVFAHTRRGSFVTFLLMIFDPPARRVSFANAGQTKPLLKSGASVRWLDHTGVNFAIGMKEDTLYQESSVDLRAGDVIVMLTDGFTEAMNILKEPYGWDRMETFLASFNTDRLTAAQILDIIVNEVRTFTGSAPQHDDMTMVVVKVTE